MVKTRSPRIWFEGSFVCPGAGSVAFALHSSRALTFSLDKDGDILTEPYGCVSCTPPSITDYVRGFTDDFDYSLVSRW